MRTRPLTIGLIALTFIWLVGLGIDHLVSAPAQAGFNVPRTSGDTVTPEPATNMASTRSLTDTQPSVILGSRMADVDLLLQGWIKSTHGSGPSYFKYDYDIRLVVNYRNGVAVGVAALSLGDRPIDSARGTALTMLVGAPPDDIIYLGGELHEIYYGDI